MTNILKFDISQLNEQACQALFRAASPQRQAKASRYRKQEDSARSLAAEALLRFAVAQTLGLCHFSVAEDAQGKPFLPDHPNFHFNLSHSGSWVVLAYGESPVGIDVQQIDPNRNLQAIAHRCFTPQEQAYVQGEPDRFYRVWTAKESYLKYLGTGLRKALHSFSVVPVGALPEVCLVACDFPGYCMTLCATSRDFNVTTLGLSQLLPQ